MKKALYAHLLLIILFTSKSSIFASNCPLLPHMVYEKFGIINEKESFKNLKKIHFLEIKSAAPPSLYDLFFSSIISIATPSSKHDNKEIAFEVNLIFKETLILKKYLGGLNERLSPFFVTKEVEEKVKIDCCNLYNILDCILGYENKNLEEGFQSYEEAKGSLWHIDKDLYKNIDLSIRDRFLNLSYVNEMRREEIEHLLGYFYHYRKESGIYSTNKNKLKSS